MQQAPRLVHSIHSEGPHAGHAGSRHHLHIVALDLPETDSHVKSLAGHIGHMTNHQSIFVTKEGQQGLQPWTIANRAHDGGPAMPEAIEFKPTSSGLGQTAAPVAL